LLCRSEKRERQREAKAEVAAQLEKSIEKELLERLQKGVYPTDIVNINMKEYEKVI
jgi:protein MAK16